MSLGGAFPWTLNGSSLFALKLVGHAIRPTVSLSLSLQSPQALLTRSPIAWWGTSFWTHAPSSLLTQSPRALLAHELVGRRVNVWWPAEGCYFAGTVVDYNPLLRQHRIR